MLTESRPHTIGDEQSHRTVEPCWDPASHADTQASSPSLGFSQAASVPPLALPPGMVAMSPSAAPGLQDPISGLVARGELCFFSRGGGGEGVASATAWGDFMRHCCVGWEQPCLGGSLTIMTEIQSECISFITRRKSSCSFLLNI